MDVRKIIYFSLGFGVVSLNLKRERLTSMKARFMRKRNKYKKHIVHNKSYMIMNHATISAPKLFSKKGPSDVNS